MADFGSLVPAPAPQPVSAYDMYRGNPDIILGLLGLVNPRGFTNEERQFGATAYGQDHQKRNEAMAIPEFGPFFNADVWRQNRASQADKENNMLVDHRPPYIPI